MMVTPDFEDWLRRQDFDVTDTATIERYRTMLAEKLGISGKSLDVAEALYPEMYEAWAPLAMKPFPRHYKVAGEPFVETRWAISGVPGAWGRESALLFGQTIAREMGLYKIAERLEIMHTEEF